MHAVELVPSAARELAKLEPSVVRRIAKRIDRLAEDPRGGGAVKLRGTDDDVWRARVGDHRILYTVDDARLPLIVVKIGHRREVYR